MTCDQCGHEYPDATVWMIFHTVNPPDRSRLVSLVRGTVLDRDPGRARETRRVRSLTELLPPQDPAAGSRGRPRRPRRGHGPPRNARVDLRGLKTARRDLEKSHRSVLGEWGQGAALKIAQIERHGPQWAGFAPASTLSPHFGGDPRRRTPIQGRPRTRPASGHANTDTVLFVLTRVSEPAESPGRPYGCGRGTGLSRTVAPGL